MNQNTASSSEQKQQVVDLLKAIETGDSRPFSVIHPTKYIQHNLLAANGLSGVRELMKAVAGTARVNTVRVFQDGNHVFAHTEYDFFGPKIGFDIFRFENGLIVEHWDNLQSTPMSLSPSGRTMLDGPTDHTKPTTQTQTDANKALIRRFTQDILIDHNNAKLGEYFDGDRYVQHDPDMGDGVSAVGPVIRAMEAAGNGIRYLKVHQVLGEGDFVLVVAEGTWGGRPTSFYDLFRVENGKVAEHWDVVETIPARKEWKNNNGKFWWLFMWTCQLLSTVNRQKEIFYYQLSGKLISHYFLHFSIVKSLRENGG